MKKNYLLGILFFSGLWGLSEAVLGGALYRAHIPHASVPLTIIAFIILTISRVYLPEKGSSTLIATCAMLYKFLNSPFFACHLLAIFLLGLSYDLVFSSSKIKNRALAGFLATYLGCSLFAFTITFLIRYHYWTADGFLKFFRYISISAPLTSLANLFFVPLSFHLGGTLKEKINPFKFKSRLVTGGASIITGILWFWGAARCF